MKAFRCGPLRSLISGSPFPQGVGSALLYAAPCRLFVSRLYRNEFALQFGGNQVLLLQAASGPDAQEWVVAIAACLFFSSASFESVLTECRMFFDAAHKTIEGRCANRADRTTARVAR